MKTLRSSLKNSIAFVCIVISVSFLSITIVSILRLPEISIEKSTIRALKPYRFNRFGKVYVDTTSIGKFGEMMVDMLPNNLKFTIFVPSEKAFERDLRLRVNESLGVEKVNDTYAILSRVLGFSTVPRVISSSTVPVDKEINYDSLSGFRLYISKGLDGLLVVNRVWSVGVVFRKGEIVVHLMNGVIMDAEFEQSFQLDDGEDD